jgi:putative ABC transport system permease protein
LGASGRSNYVRFFLVIIATLIALIVGGSALVIYNAFAISIGERKKQFGMFASVGATSAQIRRTVLGVHYRVRKGATSARTALVEPQS